MNRIGLKINGIWCVLPQDVSISIEEQNPLFSDSGSFSYPIEMSVSQNRELFKSIDSVAGRTRPHHLDGLPFELWYDGVMLLYGSTETDEDLDIEEDKCSINLVSGNGDFQSKIEGMQCTDVPLMGDVEIGRSWPTLYVVVEVNGKKYTKEIPLDEQRLMEYSKVNTSFGYDKGYPFCNVRVCCPRPDFKPTKTDKNPYIVLDADRPWSGVCFYVGYFLDCLFAHLGYVVKENNMGTVEDMNRLAFFTTKCETKYGELEEPLPDIFSDKKYMQEVFIDPYCATISSFTPYFRARKVLATEKNFPSTDVSSVLESLMNAFGLKIVVDEVNKKLSVHYMKDVLRDPDVMESDLKVLDFAVSHSKVDSVKLTFGGDEDDTVYNYSDYENPVPFTSYHSIIKEVGAFDKSCYISTITGNKYRVKIDGEEEKEGNEKSLNPVLFEVGQNVDYIVGKKDGKNQEELKISFTPAIENDVNYHNEKDGTSDQQRLAIFVDVELKEPEKINKTDWYGFEFNDPDDKEGGYRAISVDRIYQRYENYDETTTDRSPLRDYDSGFMLGVMRGPGNDSDVQVFLPDYDGNGNSAWTTVVADYAFTSDSMDAYGHRYDYNGKLDGGITPPEDTVSLKTHIQTAQELGLKDEQGNPIDWGINSEAAKRGLADSFMSEYMYFLLNRKTVKMDVDTTLSHLTSLTWLKRHRIGDTVGFIKSRSYTLSNSGVSDMNIEMYTTN